jgi:hypothetical protein
MESILHFVPKSGDSEAALSGLFEFPFVFDASYTEAINGIFKDTARKGIVLLKDHAHVTTKADDIDLRRIEIYTVDFDTAADDTSDFNEVIDAIDGAEKRALTTARWTDESGDVFTMKVEIHIKEHLMIPIGIIEFLHLDEVTVMDG